MRLLSGRFNERDNSDRQRRDGYPQGPYAGPMDIGLAKLFGDIGIGIGFS